MKIVLAKRVSQYLMICTRPTIFTLVLASDRALISANYYFSKPLGNIFSLMRSYTKRN